MRPISKTFVGEFLSFYHKQSAWWRRNFGIFKATVFPSKKESLINLKASKDFDKKNCTFSLCGFKNSRCFWLFQPATALMQRKQPKTNFTERLFTMKSCRKKPWWEKLSRKFWTEKRLTLDKNVRCWVLIFSSISVPKERTKLESFVSDDLMTFWKSNKTDYALDKWKLAANYREKKFWKTEKVNANGSFWQLRYISIPVQRAKTSSRVARPSSKLNLSSSEKTFREKMWLTVLQINWYHPWQSWQNSIPLLRQAIFWLVFRIKVPMP